LGKAAGTLRHYIVDGLSLIGLRKRKSGQYDRDTTSALEHVRSYRSMDFDEAMKYHFEVGLLPYYMRSSDHFTMGVPIEHRFPFLDYRMAELGSRMPVSYLFRNGWTKFIIRKAMEPYLPSKILWRREKMGFTFPYAWYFRKHRRYFKDLLDSEYASEPLLGAFGDYDGLLREDPLLLWRVLSVAIWNRNRPGRIGRS
jgi:asparagine synthase (glutamine-hydrolysing)